MVNFKKRLGGKADIKPVDPIQLYEKLDRAHDKGPLRPSQDVVLREWNVRQASTRDHRETSHWKARRYCLLCSS